VALIAAVGTIGVLWSRTSIVPDQVAKRFTENLLRERGYALDLDGVRGTWAGEMLFLHPRIRTLADSSRVVLRADAARLRLRDLRGLLQGRVGVAHLTFDRPRIVWGAGLPSLAGSPSRPEKDAFPRLAIDVLEIHGGSFEDARGGRLAEVDHVDARLRVESSPQAVHLRLERATGSLPRDSLRIEALRAGLRWQADTLWVQDAWLETSASRLAGGGWVALGQRGGWFAAEMRALDAAEVVRLLDRSPHGGTLRGPVECSWSGAQVTARATVSGTLDAHRFDDVEVDAESGPSGLRVQRAAGRVDECAFDLSLDLRGGALAGTLRLADADLHRLVPERAASLPAHRVSGSFSFQRRSAADTLFVEASVDAGVVRGVSIERARIRLARSGDRTWLRAVDIAAPAGRLHLVGEVDADSLDVDFDLDAADIGRLAAAFGRAVAPGGAIAVQGRAYGALAAPRLEAEARAPHLAYGGASLANAAIDFWGQDLRRDPAFEIQLRADSLCVRGHTLREVAADLAWADGTLHVERSQGSAGDTLVAVAATLRNLPRDWSGVRRRTAEVRLETVLLQIGDAEFRVEDPAGIWWTEGAVHVDSLKLVTRGGSVRLAGTLDRRLGQVAAEAQLEGLDLSFLRHVTRLRSELAGSAWGRLAAHGRLDRVRLDGYFAARAGRWNGLAFDSLAVELASDAASTEVPALQLATPQGSVRGRLRLGVLPDLAGWLGPGGRARARADLDAVAVDAELDLADVDLERWRPGAGDESFGWGARVSAHVAAAGTVRAPHVTARGTAERLHFWQRDVGSLAGEITYADEYLVLGDLRIDNEDQVLAVAGRVPCRLHLLGGAVIPRDRPMSLNAELPRSSFAVVERFLPLFEPPPAGMPRGEVEARLDVGGTLADPHLRGGFHAAGVAFSLRDMEEIYRDVTADGVFEGNTLRIQSLRGRTGEHGTIAGSGELVFAGPRLAGYSYALELGAASIRSLPDIFADVSGSLQVHSEAVGPNRILVPSIGGTLNVQRAEITQEFTAEGGEAVILETDVPEWLCDVELRAEQGDVWIRNSLVDAELEGNLRVVRTGRGIDFQGLVRVKRGTYSYLTNRFEIKSGELDFSRSPGFNPGLNIEGQRGRSGERIYVSLTGTAMEPHLAFRSERLDWSSDQIQQLLLDPTAEQAEAPATTAIADFTEQVVRDLALLPAFTIDPVATGKGRPESGAQRAALFSGVNVSAGRAISDRVFLVYTQGVKSDIKQKVSIEVDINRWLLMESAYERRNVTEAGVDRGQNAYDLNLKFRHEY
jgi:autotransporter translocation and assembly factor TamB